MVSLAARPPGERSDGRTVALYRRAYGAPEQEARSWHRVVAPHAPFEGNSTVPFRMSTTAPRAQELSRNPRRRLDLLVELLDQHVADLAVGQRLVRVALHRASPAVAGAARVVRRQE